MALQSTIAKIIDSTVLRALHNDLVALQICNKKPQQEVKKGGDTVYFTGLAQPTITAYAGTVNYEELVDGEFPLLIDQKNYYGFLVHDLDAFQSELHDQAKSSQAAEAGYGLQNVADAYVFALYAKAALTHTDSTLDSTTALSSLATVGRQLDEKNVKSGNRWIVVPPWVKVALHLAGIKFQIKNGESAGNGFDFAKEMGFDIFVSNNVGNTGTAASPVSKILAGSYNSIVYADSLVENRWIPQLESKFAGGASGLHVFGADVAKPNELLCATWTYAAETAI